MREIKFRARDITRKKWIYFSLGLCPNYIVDTLGQYTGLKDKSGKEIYEGDIVKMKNKKDVGEVIFENGSFILKREYPFEWINWPSEFFEECKVIGNIYQNKELK